MTLADVVAARLLIYGVGNIGRQDDGVGVRLVERLREEGVPPGVTLDANYQLAPEDALLLSQHDAVIVVDAAVGAGAAEPYSLAPVPPAAEVSFSTHAFDLGALVTLCTRLYGRAPRAYALALPGFCFDVNAGLSPRAAANLDAALADLRAALGVSSPSPARR